jgi:hypothetical protein
MIDNELREKFKKLYFEKFNIALSDEEATLMATDLINLVKVLLKPVPKTNQVTIPEEERRYHETIGVQHY